MNTRHDEILVMLTALVKEVVGEWADEVEITLSTSFSEDLELESIELVALAEKVQATFGADVDFVAWLSNRELSEIVGLTVGEVVAFIAEQP